MENLIRKEIEEKIKRHLIYSNHDHDVSLIWRGYIAALTEWGNITPADHDDLREMLKINDKNENDLKTLILDASV